MDTPGSESGDAIIHRTQRLIINGIGYEAVFVEGRLTLVCEDTGKPPLEIPYQDITLASAETNRLREPVIRITYGTADGGMRGIELIFIFLAAGRNIQNRDRCLTVLEKQGVPVRPDPTPADYYSRARRERMDAGTLDTEAPTGRPAVPEWTVYGPAQGTRQAPVDEPKPVSPAFTLLAIVLLAAILLVAMLSPIPEPGLQPWEKAAAGKAGVTPARTPAPAPSPAPAATPSATAGAAQGNFGTIPGNGIWVKITYPGQYAGFLSAGAWRSDVNSSGTQWYQLPVQNTVIDGFIEKGDGSGQRLEVATYNGGTLIARHETTTPRGIVEMHVSVGPAVNGPDVPITPSPVSVEFPTPPLPTDAVPAQFAVPDSGVWVQVRYPGNYTGTLSSNGQVRSVDGSGDNIYQMVMKSGTIDGTLEKADGSMDLLEILVYRDGVLTALANTTVPRGIAEIHATV